MDNKVTIKLYGREYTMERDAAIEWMISCVSNSEGSEQQRYITILKQISSGKMICVDEEDEEEYEVKITKTITVRATNKEEAIEKALLHFPDDYFYVYVDGEYADEIKWN